MASFVLSSSFLHPQPCSKIQHSTLTPMRHYDLPFFLNVFVLSLSHTRLLWWKAVGFQSIIFGIGSNFGPAGIFGADAKPAHILKDLIPLRLNKTVCIMSSNSTHTWLYPVTTSSFALASLLIIISLITYLCWGKSILASLHCLKRIISGLSWEQAKKKDNELHLEVT